MTKAQTLAAECREMAERLYTTPLRDITPGLQCEAAALLTRVAESIERPAAVTDAMAERIRRLRCAIVEQHQVCPHGPSGLLDYILTGFVPGDEVIWNTAGGKMTTRFVGTDDGRAILKMGGQDWTADLSELEAALSVSQGEKHG
jgi:hypothetical protein